MLRRATNRTPSAVSFRQGVDFQTRFGGRRLCETPSNVVPDPWPGDIAARHRVLRETINASVDLVACIDEMLVRTGTDRIGRDCHRRGIGLRSARHRIELSPR